ncbi:hypothetical protein LTR36_007251 [Oleoguttula mirabilis]|uniref:Uncharacterized protein n=1 Tax=Oleoguttula mirabilis TaxID=1507867 RepID=A0AAV9J9U3_9PEZI|nr:hypothetical protein LTR36_007251 [Oleoguttula mirabilis]
MASLRNTLRLAPRAHFIRPTPTSRILPIAQQQQQQRTFMFHSRPAEDKSADEVEQGSEDLAGGNEDPNMNGNYPDPSLTSALPIKRQFRDPYADWWDKQERRNYGEVVHEDNDILGIFSPEEYTHFKPGWGLVLIGTFAATVGVLCAAVSRFYPDKPSAPRTFPDGLEKELGGPRAPRAAVTVDDDAAFISGGSRSSRDGPTLGEAL